MTRVWQHKKSVYGNSFTKIYSVNTLVYFEEFLDISDAIQREKVLKWWSRKKKILLIEENNCDWYDLAWNWYDNNKV